MVMQIGPCVALDGQKPADRLRVSPPDTRYTVATHGLGRPAEEADSGWNPSLCVEATHSDTRGFLRMCRDQGMRRHTPSLTDCFHCVFPCVGVYPL